MVAARLRSDRDLHGFYLWHRLGSVKEFLANPSSINPGVAYTLLAALLVMLAVEFTFSPRQRFFGRLSVWLLLDSMVGIVLYSISESGIFCRADDRLEKINGWPISNGSFLTRVQN